MRLRSTGVGIAAIGIVLAVAAQAGDRSSADKAVGSTTSQQPPAPLDTRAMNAMLRADRDKDGALSPAELEQYDLNLARRFNEADSDRDGKLTLHEFEKLIQPATSAQQDTPRDPTDPRGISRTGGAKR